MKRTCKQCGKEFILTQSEIDFYKSKNLSLPKRCKECREQNKKSTSGGKIHVSPGTNEGNYRYFVRTDGSDKTGTYLHKKEEKRIRGLCQKRYYEGLLKKSKYECGVLERLTGRIS